jgi:hypothetical protein
MSHHAVSNDYHFLEAADDGANFFCCEPAHVTATRHERGSEANTSTTRDCFEHVGACGANRCKRSVQVQAGDLAIGVVAILVIIESVEGVWGAVVGEFRRFKGWYWTGRCLVS